MNRCRTALLYSQQFSNFSYGDSHPFNLQRNNLTFELLAAYDLLTLPDMEIRSSLPATEEALLTFHDPTYLARLKEFSTADEPRADFRYGLGDADCPVFKGMYECAALGTGATLEAARLVTDECFDIAFNPTGGWHHAHRAKASGFSYLNDAVVAINWLLAKQKRVVYLDLDAHHGDGVQEAFYDTDQVLTISLHESGIYFYPGTGFEHETGTGTGHGYSVNIPLLAHTDDALFLKAFEEVAYPLLVAFNPDVIVTQIGADTFRTDPLSNLEITTCSYGHILTRIKRLKIPWIALGGGGYDLMNTARAWTLAWSIMNAITLPAVLPDTFLERAVSHGYQGRNFLDTVHRAAEDERLPALIAVEQSIARLKQTVFPIILGNHGHTS